MYIFCFTLYAYVLLHILWFCRLKALFVIFNAEYFMLYYVKYYVKHEQVL